MYLLTFQHKIVLNEIINKGKYYCNHVSEYHSLTPKSYDLLARRLNETANCQCTTVIFAWQRLYKSKVLNISQIERALECTPFNCDDIYLFELNVPADKVLLTNFYNFVDLRCQEEGIDDLYPNSGLNEDEKFSRLAQYVFDIDTHDEIQAVIPSIDCGEVLNIFGVGNDLSLKKINLAHYIK